MWDLRHRRNRVREEKSKEQEEAFFWGGGGWMEGRVKPVICVKSENFVCSKKHSFNSA